MRVLVACEFSGIVRDAFRALGHDAVSCDLLPSERPGPHLQCDVRTLNFAEFDLVIAHPPCTYLAVSGARWFPQRPLLQLQALEFVSWIWKQPCHAMVLENPISVLSTKWRKPDQIIQPWQFGHGETKATCLWLRGLPRLEATCIVSGREGRVHRVSPSVERWRERSRTLPGIARAMAQQWGSCASGCSLFS